jgi:hypothetical protein
VRRRTFGSVLCGGGEAHRKSRLLTAVEKEPVEFGDGKRKRKIYYFQPISIKRALGTRDILPFLFGTGELW